MNLTSVEQYTVGSTVRLHGQGMDPQAVFQVRKISRGEIVHLSAVCKTPFTGTNPDTLHGVSYNPEPASAWLTASVVSIDGNPGLKERRQTRQARKVKP